MDSAVSARIKQARLALGLSQRKFSELLSLSGGYIGGIEANFHAPNDRLIKLITAQFGVSEHWLRTGCGQMFSEPPADEKTARLLSLFNDLQPRYQDVVLGVIELLRKARE